MCNMATNEVSFPPVTLSPSFPEEHRKQTRDGTPHHILLGMFQHQYLLVTQQFRYFTVLTLQSSTPKIHTQHT